MKSKRFLILVGTIFMVLMLCIVPLVAACAKPAPAPAPTPSPAPPPTPAPPPGPTGELVSALGTLGAEVWGLDISSTLDLRVLGVSNDFLTLYSRESQPEGEWHPGLAERWEMSPDGLTWDLYLRKGIQWHDGWGEFTAEDVKFSWEMAGRPGSVNVNATMFRKGDGGQTESVTVIDPYHVRIKLATPNIMFLYYLSDGESDFPIVCKKYFETESYDEAIKHPIGTGPWRLIEHKPAQHMKWEAVENHWRQTPDFKYLTLKVVPEESMRMAMLKAGKADIIGISMEHVAELEAAGFRIKRVPGALNAYMVLGGNVLPTWENYDPTCPWVAHQDEPKDSEWNQRALKVRKAMMFAINKQAIIDKVFMGEAVLAPIPTWSASGPFSRPEWKPYPYDPELAKKLLAEAGYPDGFEVTMDIFTEVGRESYRDMAEAICMDWETIGLTVKRNYTEWPIIRAVWAGRNSAWRASSYGAPGNPEPWIGPSYTKYSKAGFNFGQEGLEADELIEKIRSTLDFDERVELIKKLGDWVYESYYDMAIGQTNYLFVLSSKVGEWDMSRKVWTIGWFEYISHAD